jgi:hypothetical protein
MPHPNKTKGTRIERAMVKKYMDAEIPCERMIMSGALGGAFSGDLRVGTERWKGEVKSRKGGGGFVTIKRWLGDNDILVLHENYEEPLIVMTWDRHKELMQVFEREINGKNSEAPAGARTQDEERSPPQKGGMGVL